MKISSSFPRLHVLPDCTTVSGETLGQTTLDPEVILCVRECVCVSCFAYVVDQPKVLDSWKRIW